MSEPSHRPLTFRRRFLVEEVVQTSSMDCGPAALKALAGGFGIFVSYGRLREACHTDVDGTSIDTLEELAIDLGLDAEQVMLPADHLFEKESAAFPAIALVNDAAGGAHFVVVWRSVGPLVQIMDPARGRLWISRRALLESLYIHTALVPEADWRGWAATEEFLGPLRRRLSAVGIKKRQQSALIERGLADESSRGLAALDAATRMVASLRDAADLSGVEMHSTLTMLAAESQNARDADIPSHFWSAAAGEKPATVTVRGAVLVRVRGRPAGSEPASRAGSRSPEVAAALNEKPARPLRDAVALLRADGMLHPLAVVSALGIAACGVLLEAVLLRGVLDAATLLRVPEQGLVAGALLGAFALTMLVLEFALGSAEQRAGRHLEARLRIRFMDKLPRLADAYFHSRPVSDMAERCHTVHTLRTLPQLAARMLRLGMEITITTLAIAWLAPDLSALAAAAAAAAVGIPLAGQALLAGRDLRVRTHAGALGLFHLDALLGRRAIEAHGAAVTIEQEHDELLGEWARASIALQRGAVAVEGLQMLVGLGLAAAVVFGHFASGSGGATLLVAYWVLNLPALGYELAMHAREYPAHRSTLLRLLEPLTAPEGRADAPSTATPTFANVEGVRIEAHALSVRAAGQQILSGLDLRIDPGTHVAIVGSSGAGKSTLLGSLLGFHRPADGTLLIDGQSPTGASLDALRRRTAWVDPTVQLWNASLLENLVYGSDAPEALGPVLEAAGLIPVIAKLPEGLATRIGEGGSLLSAGEAQRVRLGRAMLQPKPRLVVLDEPFMGLERGRRRQLLNNVRQRWAVSTLLYVTHEVSEARAFDRVLILEHGRIIEDGDPRMLSQTPSSRYRRLLQAQEAASARFGAGSEWQRIRLEDGRIVRDAGNATIEQTA